MTPLKVIIWFLALGIIFIIIGIVFLVNNNSLLHIEHYYHGDNDDSTDFTITLEEDVDEPIYVYYTIASFYQNYAKYVDDDDLKEKSLFNDTFVISYNGAALTIDTVNITSDYDDKRSDWDGLTPQQKVWYKTAPLPTFRKLYGIIHQDLKKGTYHVVVSGDYQVPEKSKKAIVLATSSAMGGYSPWTQYVYIATGAVAVVLAVIFILLELFVSRPVGSYHPKFGSDIADTRILFDLGTADVIPIPENLLSTEAFKKSQ